MTLIEWQTRLVEWLDGMECPTCEQVHNLVWALAQDETLLTGLLELVNKDKNDYYFELQDRCRRDR